MVTPARSVRREVRLRFGVFTRDTDRVTLPYTQNLCAEIRVYNRSVALSTEPVPTRPRARIPPLPLQSREITTLRVLRDQHFPQQVPNSVPFKADSHYTTVYTYSFLYNPTRFPVDFAPRRESMTVRARPI